MKLRRLGNFKICDKREMDPQSAFVFTQRQTADDDDCKEVELINFLCSEGLRKEIESNHAG
jgi:hypothetical protein